jgi:negative regulator of sigma E activity
MVVTPVAAIALAVAVAVPGCGGDSDDQAAADRAQQEQPAARGDRAAQRLEAYLQRNSRNLAGTQVKRGQVVNDVQTAGDTLRCSPC